MQRQRKIPEMTLQRKRQENVQKYLQMWAELKGFEDTGHILMPIPIGIYADSFEVVRLLSKEKEFGPVLLDGYSENKRAVGLLINTVENPFVNQESSIFIGTVTEEGASKSFEGNLEELSILLGGQTRFLVSRVKLLEYEEVLEETTQAYEQCISNMIEELDEEML